MKGKTVFVFSSIIVVALAVLAVVAFVHNLPELSAGEILKQMNQKAGDTMESEGAVVSEDIMAPENMLKILMLLFSVGSIALTQIRNKSVIQFFAGLIYALAIAFLLGKWGICMAWAERGYEAAGGEYCLILIAGQAAGTAIGHFFESLENFKRAVKKTDRSV